MESDSKRSHVHQIQHFAWYEILKLKKKNIFPYLIFFKTTISLGLKGKYYQYIEDRGCSTAASTGCLHIGTASWVVSNKCCNFNNCNNCDAH